MALVHDHARLSSGERLSYRWIINNANTLLTSLNEVSYLWSPQFAISLPLKPPKKQCTSWHLKLCKSSPYRIYLCHGSTKERFEVDFKVFVSGCTFSILKSLESELACSIPAPSTNFQITDIVLSEKPCQKSVIY